MMLEVVFWVSLGLLLASYIAYPLGLALAMTVRRRPPTDMCAGAEPDFSSVAVVIAAHDEEVHIQARVRNLLDQNYPGDRLHIYIGSDGSTDRTVALLQEFQTPRLHVFPFAKRRGKACVLNDVIAQVTQPIIVLSDANVTFDVNAVAALVRRLQRPRTGAVCGELILKRSSGDNQDSTYWRFERFLKSAAGSMDALLGANGAIYAIRRDLFEPLPPDTIIDDFVLPMRIASRGWRLVYEPEARAWEDTPDRIEDEFRRRLRIGIGNYQALFRYPQFLLRGSPLRATCYLFHKVLRWFGPHLLLCMLITSALLANRPPFGVLLAIQCLIYGGLLIANPLRKRLALPRWVLILMLFATVNVAFGVAFWRYLTSSTAGQWTRTDRGETL